MTTPAPGSTAWLTVALEEYKALRAEVVDAIQAQRTIMQLGITGTSVLVGIGVQQAPSILSIAIMAAVVPTVALFIASAAWGELFRSARASSFLHAQEGRINSVVTALGSDMHGPAMDWERWLRQQPITIGNTAGQFFAFYFLAVGSTVTGIAMMHTEPIRILGLPAVAYIGVAVTGGTLCIATLVAYRFLRTRTERQFRQI